MLNEIREGYLSPATIDTFRRLSRPPTGVAGEGIEAAELFPLRREADLANTRRMQRLTSKVFKYKSKEGGIIEDTATRKNLLSNCSVSEVLELKQGAQVMLVKNLDSILVNGSQGRVVGFANKDTFFHAPWHDADYVESEDSHAMAEMFTDIAVAPEKCLPLYPVVCFPLADGRMRTIICFPQEWAVER
jgi:ATP-dependent DNA helicase PIF1